MVVREELNILDFILVTIFMEPAIPPEPYFIGFIVFTEDDLIVVWADGFQGIGELGGETPDNIGLGDGSREDGNDDSFLAEGGNPSDVGLEDCLGDLGFLVQCLIVAHEVEVNLSEEEQDGFICGLSYNSLYFLSFWI